MFLLDSLLVGGIRFVLDKVALAVDQEMNDEGALRERLLEAQMQLELGDISEGEFTTLERDILDRLREIRRRTQGDEETSGEYRITGVEASYRGDE